MLLFDIGNVILLSKNNVIYTISLEEFLRILGILLQKVVLDPIMVIFVGLLSKNYLILQYY